ncbi:MAG: multidrug effflux MFS transporter [bacterium]|nr:multidrug effflux MFS transporter [bacterium]
MNKKYLIILMTVMIFLVVSSTDIYISSLPLITKYFNVPINISTLTLSGYTLGLAIFGIFTGILSERFGRKKILITGLSVYTVSSFLIFMTPSMWLFIIFRLTQSFGASFIMISIWVIIKDILTKKEQLNATGTLILGTVISPALAPGIGAYIAEYSNWRFCFLFSAVLATILLAITFIFFKETIHKKIIKLPPPIQYIKSYIKLLRIPNLLPCMLIISASYASYFSFITISSFIYIRELDFSPKAYSLIFILIAAAYLLGNTFMRKLNKKNINLLSIVSIGVSSTILGTVILLLCKLNPSHIYIAVILTIGVVTLRAAIAITNPPLQVHLVNYFKGKGGQVLGITYFTQFMGCTLGAFIVSFFSNIPIFGLIISSVICLILITGAYIKLKNIFLKRRKFYC